MPWRSAVFICVSAVVPSVAVYQVALVVRSVPARVNLNGVLAYAAFSTLIWLEIWESGMSPFAMPVPLLMTCQ